MGPGFLYFGSLISSFSLPLGKERRGDVIDSMEKLKDSNINCFSCTGKCCTFVANSMQVDPLEGIELYSFLELGGRINDELFTQLSQCISEFRLDYHLDTGGGQSMRRTYTCPFFTPGPKGCSIAPEYKPYGCLAFNARSEGVSDGADCGSDLGLLEKREKAFAGIEQKVIEHIKADLKLDWDKLPIPVALIDIHEKIKNK